MTATDENGNSSECSFFIHPEDTTPPPLTCPTNLALNVSAACEAVVPDFTDQVELGNHCSPTTVYQFPEEGHVFFDDSPQEIIFTAIDDQNNQSSCTSIVTIVDVESPVFDCVGQVEVLLDDNCEALVPDFSTVSVSDNCQTNFIIVQDVPAGTTIQTNILVTLSTLDDSGNPASCEILVVVVDQSAPSLDCPSDRQIQVDSDCAWVIPDLLLETIATDNCDGSVQLQQQPTPGTIYQLGDEVIVTITAQDDFDNIAACQVTLTSVDNSTPTVTCPADQIIHTNDDCTNAFGDWSNEVIVESNCQQLELIQFPMSTEEVTIWDDPILVTMDANADNGTTTSCSFNVTFIDDVAPIIICEPTIQSVNSACEYQIEDLSYLLTTQSECHPHTIQQFPSVGTIISLEDTPIEVGFEVSDIHGNTSICQTTLELVDQTPPELICPNEVFEIHLDAVGQANLPDFLSLLLIEEPCSEPVHKEQFPPGGTLLTSIGEQSIQINIEDDAGNEAQCSLEVLVIDSISPLISLDAVFEATLDQNCQYEMEDWRAQFSWSDNYSNDLEVVQIPAPGSVFQGAQQIEIVVEVTDESGNTSSLMTTIMLTDNTNPAAICPSSIELQLNEQCAASIPELSEWVEVVDNCPGQLSWQQSIPPGSLNFLDDWNNELVLIISDASNNAMQCVIGLLPMDSIAPVIVCPDDWSVDANPDSCLSDVFLGDPVVSDNCSQFTWQVISGPDPNGSFSFGVYETTYEAIDDYGNISTCSTTFEVLDITAPEITCSMDTVLHVLDNCLVQIPNLEPEIWDACGIETTELIEGPATSQSVSLGGYNQTWEVTDLSGNVSSCTNNISVIDVTDPIIQCPDNIVVSSDENSCGTHVEYEISATDNCSVEWSILAGLESASYFEVGETTIAAMAVDNSGNQSQCAFSVTVQDVTEPDVQCPDYIFVTDFQETFSLPHVLDACGVEEVFGQGDWPPNYPLESGYMEFEFIGIDVNGNLGNCFTTVYVNAPPIAQDDVISTYLVSETIDPLANDNDPDGSIVLLNPGDYPDYVTVNPDNTFTIFLEELMCQPDSFQYEIRDVDGLTDQAWVKVIPDCPYNLEIPQLISPNDDNINDLLVINGLENFPENEIVIFNESGQQVFRQKSYDNSWDATSNSFGVVGNSKLPQGTYYILLHLESLNRPIKGSLTIVY
ncbi:MAG: HYR domain-containing protein [Bacteroidota bacterium]